MKKGIECNLSLIFLLPDPWISSCARQCLWEETTLRSIQDICRLRRKVAGALFCLRWLSHNLDVQEEGNKKNMALLEAVNATGKTFLICTGKLLCLFRQ